MKRPVCGIVLVIILGEIIATAARGWFWCVPFAILLLGVKSVTKKQGGFFVMLFFFGIWGNLNMQYDMEQQRQVEGVLEKEKTHKVVGRVAEISEGKNGWNIVVESGKINGVFFDKFLVTVPQEPEVSVGAMVGATGKGTVFSGARNFGNFDVRNYYMSREIFGRIQSDSVRVTGSGKDDLRQWLLDMKKVFGKQLEKICPDHHEFLQGKRQFFEAILLGEKNDMEEEIKSLYSAAGIAHILAISSLHISLIGLFLYQGMRRKFGFVSSASVSFAIIIAFGILSGMSVATIRAIIMFALKLVGDAIGRVYDGLTAISLAAVILLLENPFVLFHSGFQMSFVAVIAIVPVWNLFQKVFRVKNKFLRTILFSFNVQWMMAPVIAYYYYELPSYALVLNLMVVPLMGIVLVSGILGILGSFGVIALGRILIYPGCFILSMFTGMCRVAEKIPGHRVIVGKTDLWKIFLYYGIYAGLLVIALKLRRKKENGKRQFIGKQGVNLVELAGKQRKLEQWWRKVCVLTGIGMVCVLGIIYIQKEEGFYVSFLDVGQGDGIVIHTGQGVNITIDGGSSSVKNVGKNRILPFLKAKGISNVDYAVMSHADEDHINGLREMILQSDGRGILIEHLVMPKLAEPDEAYEELMHLAKSHNIKIFFIEKGQKWKLKDMTLECLWPKQEIKGENRNDFSTVLKISKDSFSMLLTGDISEEVEEKLDWTEGNCTLLKVAHHGSKYSSSDGFLERIHPKISVISVGKGNLYGHPAKEVLERLKQVGSLCLRTDERGGITVRLGKGKIKIESSF